MPLHPPALGLALCQGLTSCRLGTDGGSGPTQLLLRGTARCRRRRDRRPSLLLLVARQRKVAVAVPQPEPPAPEAPSGPSAPKWAGPAFAAGMLAVAAAALKLAWSFRQPAAPPPPPPPAEAAVEAAKPPEAASLQLKQPVQPPQPPAGPLEAARSAVKQAGEALAASNGTSAAATAASVGPVLLAAETAGVVDETPTMTLEQLRSTATELYMLIQQVGREGRRAGK